MKVNPQVKTCPSNPASANFCPAPCPAHGTTCACPPLIVLAVLSAEQVRSLPGNRV